MAIVKGEYLDTLLPDSYLGYDPPHEERERARRADEISQDDTLKRFGWDEAAFARARELGFPGLSRSRLVGVVRIRRENFYSRRAIAEWQSGLVAFVAALPKD